MSDETMRRRELGRLLRELRARLSPPDLGLPPRFRARTPGLRREDVAALAGISTTLYTWLEQGRDIRLTPRVMEGLARALRLSTIERLQVEELASAGERRPAVQDAASVSPLLQRLLDGWQLPAVIRNPRWDILAWNRAARAVIIDFEALPPERRNTLWYCFTDRTHQQIFENWPREARSMVGRFRIDYARHAGDPSFTALVAGLSQASEEFAGLWASHHVLPQGEVAITYRDAEMGAFTAQHIHLNVTDAPELRLILWVPGAVADDEARIRRIIRRFADRPGSPGTPGPSP